MALTDAERDEIVKDFVRALMNLPPDARRPALARFVEQATALMTQEQREAFWLLVTEGMKHLHDEMMKPTLQ